MLTSPSSVVSLLAVIYMLYIFSVLSRKLGGVTKMKPYYRGYYWAIGLMAVAVVAHSLNITSRISPDLLPEWLSSDLFFLMTYYLPMALAATVSLIVTWRYWGWLFREREP
jgi:hypothetical protein